MCIFELCFSQAICPQVGLLTHSRPGLAAQTLPSAGLPPSILRPGTAPLTSAPPPSSDCSPGLDPVQRLLTRHLSGRDIAVPTMETPGPGLWRRPSPWRPGVQLRLYFSSRALGRGDWRGSVSRPCAQPSQLHRYRILGRRCRAQKGKSANL